MERLPSHVIGPRLALRPWEPEDAEAAEEAIAESLAELKPFLPWAKHEPMTLAERRDLFSGWERSWEEGGDSYLVMLDGELIVGSTGLHRRGERGRVEIGYWVRTGYTGRGYATEAARILTTAAFAVPHVEIVAIHHDVANLASRRIPERLGFRLVGEVTTQIQAPGQTGRELQWEMTSEEWSG